MNRNRIVLIILFIFPIIAYLVFASAKHNSLFLKVISENNREIPKNWKTSNDSIVQLKGKITVLGFVGNNIKANKANLFNLNQKIYNKYYGFKDFQFVMIAPLGSENDCREVLESIESIVAQDLTGWKFVFASNEEINDYYQSLNLETSLDENFASPNVILLDKEINHRGRKGKNKKGEEEYKESYNTISAADLHNEMSDDVKILLREYRLALKKNKRKDTFRDNITNKVEQNSK